MAMNEQAYPMRGTDFAGRAGEKRADVIRLAIATEANSLGGITARIEGADVVMEGRNLLERWLRDAELRHIGRRMG